MKTDLNNFQNLMRECGRINPDSLTSSDDDRIRSVEAALRQSPGHWLGMKVLILGAGDGHECIYARDALGWEPTGLTYLKGELDAKVTPMLVLGDMHALPFEDGSFDYIYSKETLEHSPCPYLALLEINRVLRSGGEFFHLIPYGWEKQRDWYHFSCFQPEVWCDLFRKAYLKVETVSMQPDCDRCSFGNAAYFGRKVGERRILEESVERYKENLSFGRCQSSEGLL